MPLKYALGYASCVGILVLAKPLELRSGPNIAGSVARLHPSSDLIALNLDPIPTSNQSLMSLQDAEDKGIRIQCDGSSYGFDLDIYDCEEAEAYFPADSHPALWAERHTGWQKEIVFPLPYRSMGDKALCYVEPVLVDDATSARATPHDVRNAAVAIRHECASGGRLQGGIATDIGTKRLHCREFTRVL